MGSEEYPYKVSSPSPAFLSLSLCTQPLPPFYIGGQKNIDSYRSKICTSVYASVISSPSSSLFFPPSTSFIFLLIYFLTSPPLSPLLPHLSSSLSLLPTPAPLHTNSQGVLDLLANRCLAQGTNAWTDVDHTCYTVSTAGSEGFLNLLPIYLEHVLYPTLTVSGNEGLCLYIDQVYQFSSP